METLSLIQKEVDISWIDRFLNDPDVRRPIRVKTYKEIIDETVEYYQNNDRSIKEDGIIRMCMYHSSSGLKCAVGRVMLDTALLNVKEGRNVADMIYSLGDDMFMPEYRNKGAKFWGELQALHDFNKYWNGGVLTEEGRYKVSRMHETWDNLNI